MLGPDLKLRFPISKVSEHFDAETPVFTFHPYFFNRESQLETLSVASA